MTAVDALAPQTVALFRRWCTPFSLAETAAQGKGAAALHGALTVGFSALAGHTLAPEPAAEPAAEPAGSAAPVAVAAVPPPAAVGAAVTAELALGGYSAVSVALDAAADATLPVQLGVARLLLAAAVAHGLPVILGVADGAGADAEAAAGMATQALVRLLLEVVPSGHAVLLRCGVALLTQRRPTLGKLLAAYPAMLVGLSGRITHAKVDKQLLDIAFDLPAGRIVLATEAPACLPAALAGGASSPSRTLLAIPARALKATGWAKAAAQRVILGSRRSSRGGLGSCARAHPTPPPPWRWTSTATRPASSASRTPALWLWRRKPTRRRPQQRAGQHRRRRTRCWRRRCRPSTMKRATEETWRRSRTAVHCMRCVLPH